MREHLLGYRFGALEGSEHARVQRRLDNDPQLRHDLYRLDDRLEVILDDPEPYDPPSGLAARTCAAIAAASL